MTDSVAAFLCDCESCSGVSFSTCYVHTILLHSMDRFVCQMTIGCGISLSNTIYIIHITSKIHSVIKILRNVRKGFT